MSKKKKIFLGLLIVFVILQFFRPSKTNLPVVADHTISATFNISPGIKSTLETSCYDCHSNRTTFPWYTEIQPVGWWLQDHVNEGRGELNFDEFATYSPRRQFHKLEEIGEQVEEGEMPLTSYTIMHGKAKLSDVQKKELKDWSDAMRDSMKLHYPADSLKMKPRK